MCAYWDIPSKIHSAGFYHMNSQNSSQMHYHTAQREYMMGNFSTLGRFPEMYMTLEGTPFANCPELLVVIALLVVLGCVAPPLYVYRRKIYYKMVMVVYRRRKDKLARELKKRMKVYTEDTSLMYRSDGKRGSEVNMNCLICMDALLDVKTTDLVILLDACGHRFHFKCILKWLDMSDGCPMCRKTVDVNDRKALRLVYMDCRPTDGDANEAEDENEAESGAAANEETEMLPIEPVHIPDNEQSAPLSVTVDIDSINVGAMNGSNSCDCCDENISHHSIDIPETEPALAECREVNLDNERDDTQMGCSHSDDVSKTCDDDRSTCDATSNNIMTV